MIKKLFTLLLVAAASINAWGDEAANYRWGVVDNWPYTTVKIRVHNSGEPGRTISAVTWDGSNSINYWIEHDNGYSNVSKVIVTGEITNDDASQLKQLSDKVTYLDLSECNNISADLQVNSHVTTVIAPTNWSTDQAKTFVAGNSGVTSLRCSCPNDWSASQAQNFVNSNPKITLLNTNTSTKVITVYSTSYSAEDAQNLANNNESYVVVNISNRTYTIAGSIKADAQSVSSPISRYINNNISSINSHFTTNGDCDILKIVGRSKSVDSNESINSANNWNSLFAALGEKTGSEYLKDIKILSLENVSNSGHIAESYMSVVGITTNVAKSLILPTVEYGVGVIEPSANIPVYQVRHYNANGANEYLIECRNAGALASIGTTYNSDALTSSLCVKLVGSFNNVNGSADEYNVSTGYINASDMSYIKNIEAKVRMDKVICPSTDKAAVLATTGIKATWLTLPLFDSGVKVTIPELQTMCANNSGINVASQFIDSDHTLIAYSKRVNKMYSLIEMLRPNKNQWNTSFKNVKLGGYLSAKDIASQSVSGFDKNGHFYGAGDSGSSCTCKMYNESARDFSAIRVPSTDYPYTLNVKYTQSSEVKESNVCGAFGNSHFINLDLQYAEFLDGNNYYPADMTISALVYNDKLESVILPTASSQFIIPDRCFKNVILYKNRKIMIPRNFKEIHSYAFNDCGIDKFTTTAAYDGEVIGVNQDGEIDKGNLSIVLPSGLTYIGYQAFVQKPANDVRWQDVYSLAKKTPICELYAFSNMAYCSNDKMDATHSVKRGNYITTGIGMCMLHYPEDSDDKSQYTDLTKKYNLYDETGTSDNTGNIYIWPTQEQYLRVFNQATAGVLWDAWIPYVSGQMPANVAWAGDIYGCVSSHDAAYLLAVNHTGGETLEIHFKFAELSNQKVIYDYVRSYLNHTPAPTTIVGTPWNAAQDEAYKMTFATTGWSEDWKNANYGITSSEWSDKWAESITKDNSLTYDWVSYGGWHQFVLTEQYYYRTPDAQPDENYYNFDKYKKNDWYSICLPFNLTQAKLLEIFGDPTANEYPEVITLARVVRDKAASHVTLDFSKNLINSNNETLSYDSDGAAKLGKASSSSEFTSVYVKRGTDEPVIKAHHPYYIRPHFKNNAKDVQDYIAAGNHRRFIVPASVLDADNYALPDITIHVNAISADKKSYITDDDAITTDASSAYKYYFVGTYKTQQMPKYAYYLGTSSVTGLSTVFRNVGTTKQWGKNSCIIIGMTSSEGSLQKKLDYSENNKGSYIVDASASQDFNFHSSSSAAKSATFTYDFEGEDGMSDTQIMYVNADDTMTSFSENANVYNVSGQVVGKYSDSLPKGIYIIQGKKIVVR